MYISLVLKIYNIYLTLKTFGPDGILPSFSNTASLLLTLNETCLNTSSLLLILNDTCLKIESPRMTSHEYMITIFSHSANTEVKLKTVLRGCLEHYLRLTRWNALPINKRTPLLRAEHEVFHVTLTGHFSLQFPPYNLWYCQK